MSLMNLFIPQAMAATTAAAPHQQQSMSSLFVMLFVIIAMMYFLIWRPQSKRSKEHRDLIASLSVGDEVITNGGIFGKIKEINDQDFLLTVAENTDIKIQRSAVSMALPKGTV